MRLPILTTSCKMYCIPCFRRIQSSHSFPHLTMNDLNAGFHLNGKTIQNSYVFTLFYMVSHLEGGQGEHCDLYITMYFYVFIFRFCWWCWNFLINCGGLILPVKIGPPAFYSRCICFYYIYICKKKEQIYGGKTIASVTSCRRWVFENNQSRSQAIKRLSIS